MYFFMFDEYGDVICSGVTTEANLADGAIEVTKEMYEAPDHSIYYRSGAEILVRNPRPSPNHIWLTVDGVYIWKPSLSKLKAGKSNEILQACQFAIVSGFVSYALDGPHHYPSKVLDQQNLAASVLASYDPFNDESWTTPFWCSDADGLWRFLPHTAAQIREVGRDAKSAVLAFQFRNEQLQADILAAVTAEEIEVIAF